MSFSMRVLYQRLEGLSRGNLDFFFAGEAGASTLHTLSELEHALTIFTLEHGRGEGSLVFQPALEVEVLVAHVCIISSRKARRQGLLPRTGQYPQWILQPRKSKEARRS